MGRTENTYKNSFIIATLLTVMVTKENSERKDRNMNSEIEVRSYCSHDLNQVKKILLNYTSPTGRVWNENAVEEMMSDALKEQPDGVFVAEINGEVLGFAIVIYRDWFNIAYLDYIQVKMEWIGKGVGHKLIQKCIKWVEEKGARILYTETEKNNERANKFYQKHGFKITGSIPDYYQEEIDAVILVRKLD
jgi:ribosomal protein S18 acetylase RimI-like enzyme